MTKNIFQIIIHTIFLINFKLINFLALHHLKKIYNTKIYISLEKNILENLEKNNWVNFQQKIFFYKLMMIFFCEDQQKTI